MFKRLKEKKELEEKFGITSNQRSDENEDNKDICEELSLNNSFDYNSDDSIAGKDQKISDNRVDNQLNNNLDNNLDTNVDKSVVDSLNDQILRLNKLNSTLESQVRQLSDDKLELNKQIVAKTEEVIYSYLKI